MPDFESLLCVGGPLSGRRVGAKPGNGFAVPVLDTKTTDGRNRPHLHQQVPVNNTRYVSEMLNTLEGQVVFWVPEGQKPLKTLELLLNAFERSPISMTDDEIRDGIRRARAIAEPVGSLHSLWDTILDAEAILEGRRSVLGRAEVECELAPLLKDGS